MHIVNLTGRKGEEEAAKYLQKHGYKILEKNYRKKYAEIDIIATKDNVLVFIEVKTRTSDQFGTPFEAITYFKLQSLIKASLEYQISHPKLPEELRIDGVAIYLNKNEEVLSIEHIENISG